jgi:hypothetical protein
MRITKPNKTQAEAIKVSISSIQTNSKHSPTMRTRIQ